MLPGFLRNRNKKHSVGQWVFASVLLWNFLFLVPQAHAQMWGTSNIFSDLMMNIVEIIQTQLKAALLGTLKVAATEIINSKVGQMVGGTTVGNAKFVTDWNQFLYTKPAETTSLYMNDFFSKVTQGKDVAINYVGIGDTSSNVGGNYVATLVEKAKASIAASNSQGSEELPELTYNLDDYGNPNEIFGNGDWGGFNAFITNPLNNPMGFEMISTQVFQRQLAQKQEEAKTEAQSSGYLGVKNKDGKTIAPQATIEAMHKDAMNIGNTIIAAATEPGEFLSGVILALVNKTVTNIVQNGAGKIQASIKKEIKAYDAKVSKKIGEVDKKLGPAAKYLKSVSQRVDTKVKPYTKPPPTPNGMGASPDCGVAC